jgi:hypothetical protein
MQFVIVLSNDIFENKTYFYIIKTINSLSTHVNDDGGGSIFVGRSAYKYRDALVPGQQLKSFLDVSSTMLVLLCLSLLAIAAATPIPDGKSTAKFILILN